MGHLCFLKINKTETFHWDTLAAIDLHFLFITSFLRLMRDCGIENSCVQKAVFSKPAMWQAHYSPEYVTGGLCLLSSY